jgi:hypothetical protein
MHTILHYTNGSGNGYGNRAVLMVHIKCARVIYVSYIHIYIYIYIPECLAVLKTLEEYVISITFNFCYEFICALCSFLTAKARDGHFKYLHNNEVFGSLQR